MKNFMRTCRTCIGIVAVLGLTACGGGSSQSSQSSPPNATYQITGTVSGLSSGASINLQDNGADTLKVANNGGFSFPTALANGASYRVSISAAPSGETCTLVNPSGKVGTTNITNVQVACSASSTPVSYTETIVHSFGGFSGDGVYPMASLFMDASGNLYGTTYNGGGTNNTGTVFKITPSGQETIIYSFGSASNDGVDPQSNLIMDTSGNLYGTTFGGGDVNYSGTVFKVTPNGQEIILHSFGSSGDGWGPNGGLIMDTSNNLYGTTNTYVGNNYYTSSGTVFKITPSGQETILHSFGGVSGDGQTPQAGLIMDTSGNLYGTTQYGGSNNNEGTVFKITPSGQETILYSFGGVSGDGQNPQAGLIMDTSGNLYGTTYGGGAYSSTYSGGTVFKVTPNGQETVLYSFGGVSGDGQNPQAGLIMDTSGNLYGTTYSGGSNNSGTVFKLTAH